MERCNLIQQHPRESIVSTASAEIAKAVVEISSKHDLTTGELFAILAEIQGRWAAYQIRDERLPKTTDGPGESG